VLAVANGPIGESEGFCLIDVSNGIRLPDFERATDVKTNLGHGWPRVLAFSPDGNRLAVGGEGYVALWDARTGRRLQDIEPSSAKPLGTVWTVAFAPDSKRAYAFGGLWNLATRDFERLPGTKPPDGVAFSSDGSRIATRTEGIFTVMKYPSLEKQNEFGHRQPSGGHLEFSADGIHLMSDLLRIGNKPYVFWSIETGVAQFIPFEELPLCDLSPDGALLPGVAESGVVLMHATDGRIVHRLSYADSDTRDELVTGNSVSDIRFSPNQSAVAVSRRAGISIWKDKDGFKASV
jgi:WD40 repeat protein